MGLRVLVTCAPLCALCVLVRDLFAPLQGLCASCAFASACAIVLAVCSALRVLVTCAPLCALFVLCAICSRPCRVCARFVSRFRVRASSRCGSVLRVLVTCGPLCAHLFAVCARFSLSQLLLRLCALVRDCSRLCTMCARFLLPSCSQCVLG